MEKADKLLLFFIITILITPVLLAGPALAQPKIHIPEQSYDFGNVEEGISLEHYFEIVNTGTEVLLIKDVIPT